MMEFSMKPFVLLIIFNVIYLTKFSFGSCPESVGLGPRLSDEDKSMCAIVYKDKQCGGAFDEIYNGESNSDMSHEWNNEITSLVVREGCVYTGYEHDGLDDGHDHKAFEGVHDDLNHEPIHITDWSNAISSFKCTCIFNPVDCEPTDEWAQLFACSNSQGDGHITCKYHQSHGYTIGDGQSNGHDISGTIGGSVMAEMSEIFAREEITGSGQLTSGYSWTQSHEFTQSYEEGVEVDFNVEAGKSAAVYQVQGSCGDSVIGAQCYDIRDEATNKVIRTDCPSPTKL